MMLSKLKVMWRERSERIAEKKAARVHSEHGHGRFFLLTVPATATILAAITEWYWALLFCIEATGRLDWNFETALASSAEARGAWDFAFAAHIPVLIGLVCATVPIVMLSMVWLPVQFTMRGMGRWCRGSVIAVGVLANILVIVSGTVVMNYSRQDQVRDALVVEQQAGQNRVAIQAQIDAVQADLERLADRRVNNEYAATAANVGAVAYRAQYMSEEALARSPIARRDIIVRALGAAERADALRAERTALIGQLASAPTEAAVALNVEDTVGADLNRFAQVVEVWRPPFVAVICTLIGIFGAWWTLALMQGLNPRDVLRSGWADEAHRIEDHSAEEPIVAEPMRPHREAVFDAETGDEMVPVRATWRRKPKKKGVPERVAIQPEAATDESGVAVDGGNRMASSPGGPIDVDALAPASQEGPAASASEPTGESEHDGADDHASEEVEHSELSEDDALLLFAEPPVEADDVPENNADSSEPDQQSEHVALPNEEGVMLTEDEQEREPETNPARMIGVAAE